MEVQNSALDISSPYKLTLDEFKDLLNSGKKLTIRCQISPEIAEWIVENINTKNRSLKQSRKNLAKIIADDKWHFNGQTIGFGRDGLLQDGQNRLYASIDAQKPIDVLLVFGLNSEAIRGTDRGCVRTNSDHVMMMVGKEGKPTLYASASAFWHRFVNNKIPNRGFTPDADELDKIREERPGLLDSLKFVHALMKEHKTVSIPTPMLAFYHYAMTEIDADKGNDFITRLITGERLSLNDPIMTLRTKTHDLSNGRTKIRSVEVQAFIHKCWNAHIKGQELTTKSLGLLKGWGPQKKYDEDGESIRKRSREAFPKLVGQEIFFEKSEVEASEDEFDLEAA